MTHLPWSYRFSGTLGKSFLVLTSTAPPALFKAASRVLKQPSGDTGVPSYLRAEAELTSPEDWFFLHPLLNTRPMFMRTGLGYLLVLGSRTVISPMPDPFRLHEQDQMFAKCTGPWRISLEEGLLSGVWRVTAWAKSANCCGLTCRCGFSAAMGPFPTAA